ncbi:hypothetical protein ACHAWX_007052 [Stephanocyclus meneghinianus]
MIGRSSFLAFLASLALLSSGKVTPAAARQPSAANRAVVEYQPADKKNGIGKILDWGLAKIERLYDGAMVSDLFSAFVTKCDKILHILVHSFHDITLTYTELHRNEIQRLEQFDKEFKELLKLRNKIDRKCLYTTNVDDRSLCVEKGIDVNSKIQDLRRRRTKSAKSIDWYKEMIAWCASYKNWFC